MYSCIKGMQDCRGQASVEAAFLVPLIFILLLLLIQPGIVLYSHMVMQGAASEGCRLLTTKTDAAGMSEEKCKGYILRRLGSVPMQDNFHLHEGGCTWDISFEGDESSEQVSVSISNQLRLLPLFDGAGTLLGFADGSGAITRNVKVTMPTQPSWVSASEFGIDPQAWIGKWSA